MTLTRIKGLGQEYSLNTSKDLGLTGTLLSEPFYTRLETCVQD